MGKAQVRNISFAVLDGGLNSRFAGVKKSTLRIGENTIMEHIIEIISLFASEIMIISPHQYHFAGKKIKVIPDIIPAKGPLGGIYTALKNACFAHVFIIAADMPFISPEIINNQIVEYFKINTLAFIPRTGKYSEPLHAIYNVKLAESLGNYLKTSSSFKIMKFIEAVHFTYFDLPETPAIEKVFTNINTPDDYDRLNLLDKYKKC